jgi:dTDP-L-rhamnose 4-epimerase
MPTKGWKAQMDSDAGLGHVLVTGGAGFIGCALSNVLADQASSWTVVDNLHPQVHPARVRPAALHPKARLHVADVSEVATWEGLSEEPAPDVVLHLAAETGTGQSLTEASRHGMVNVVGTTQLVDWLGRRAVTPRQLVLTSSRAVYGEGAWASDDGTVVYPGPRTHQQLESREWDFAGLTGVPVRSDRTQPAPTSVYGATKLAQEHILSAWANAHGVRLTIFRMQNVYGPGQALSNPYTGIVTLFSRLARAGRSIPLYEDGEIVRDFVFIDDVAAAIAAGVRGMPAQGAPFDVGSGQRTTIRQLAAEIAGYHGAPSPTVVGLYRDGDVRHAVAEIERTTRELAWRPRVGLELGIARLQDWIKDVDDNSEGGVR